MAKYEVGFEFPIVETFYSIQGEGRYVGTPSLFIRLAGCTRACPFCDTDFESVSSILNLGEMKSLLRKYRDVNVVWTGGEPLLHWESISNLYEIGGKHQDWHMETNGDLLIESIYEESSNILNYLAVSPKCLETAKKVYQELIEKGRRKRFTFDIKVASDTDVVNKELLPYATMIMPLTYDDIKVTKEIQKKVIQYALDKKIRYSPRLHVDIWGFRTKGV